MERLTGDSRDPSTAECRAQMSPLAQHVWRRLPRGPRFHPAYRVLLKTALAGLNFGSIGGIDEASETVALTRLEERGDPEPIIFDIGAHLGLYAEMALAILPRAVLHCFEPNPAAFRALSSRIGQRATLHNHGFSDAAARLPLYADTSDSSSASLHPQPDEPWHVGAFTERATVEVVRLDDFCGENGIDRIDLVKMDIEGHELRALRGAESLLASGSIRSIQFEFGPPALAAHTTLADFYDLLDDRYELARLVPGAAIPVPYHPREEIYLGVNYLATLRR